MAADKDIDAADWTDQDLLTRDEAGERLVAEIESTRNRLSDLESRAEDSNIAASIEMNRRRLIAMQALQDSL
ncbi:hypothetical protein OG874_17580 [Nocardia sp. NBC_00565]|uniref:hypothetical protein n=1 Tax=Nocardia sp. NBC_00565 TaxID=2975993 RepID=UPI002E818D3E|nr:hypothetical protein [Nocardia sp. NBC_00565]WUC06810.1 hypothetical protein OG874_17580 [Nocardia sp. NBC_00565]